MAKLFADNIKSYETEAAATKALLTAMIRIALPETNKGDYLTFVAIEAGRFYPAAKAGVPINVDIALAFKKAGVTLF